MELEFKNDSVAARWDGQSATWPVDAFDQQHQWTIRRLVDLTDAVSRQINVTSDMMEAVSKAWRCIGENLFTTAIPEPIRERIRRASDPDVNLLKLRLSFEDVRTRRISVGISQGSGNSEDPDDDFEPGFSTLGRSRGILVERWAPPIPATSKVPSDPVWDVLIVNAYTGRLNAAGDRVRDELHGFSNRNRCNTSAVPTRTSSRFQTILRTNLVIWC